MNLATAWFDGLAFLCPVCLLESQDSACDICGRPLTAKDLAPLGPTLDGAGCPPLGGELTQHPASSSADAHTPSNVGAPLQTSQEPRASSPEVTRDSQRKES